MNEALSTKDAKKLNKASALYQSSNPKDQDRARARKTEIDYKDLLRQINARKKMKEQNELAGKWKIDPSAHKKAQKKTKLRNLAKGNTNPNEKAAAEKKAGGPKLMGEGKKKGLDGKECWDGYKLAGTKKKGGKTVDNCVKVDEAKVDAGKSPEQKEKDRNVRKFGVSHNVAGHGKLRRALHRSDRGDKKIKGDKSQYVEMEGTDKAYEYVVSKLKKKYGDGVLTKGDKIKPKTAAQKKAAAAHQAKVDRENAAERAKDPSQGRYPPGYSNRGSD